MSKPKRSAPTPIDIPAGTLRVWWIPPIAFTVQRFTVPVATIQQARTVLRTLTSYDEFRREGTGSGGLEVLDDAAWREWHNADGNDIRWVMADAEAATNPLPSDLVPDAIAAHRQRRPKIGATNDGDPPDRRFLPRWKP